MVRAVLVLLSCVALWATPAFAALSATSSDGYLYGDEVDGLTTDERAYYVAGAMDAYYAILTEVTELVHEGESDAPLAGLHELLSAIRSLPDDFTLDDLSNSLYNYADGASNSAEMSAAMLLWRAMLAGRVDVSAEPDHSSAKAALQCVFGGPEC